ncbi:MAG: YceI family protein [Chloroflexota bacterium]
MMRKQTFRFLHPVWILVLILVLAACGGEEPEPTPVPPTSTPLPEPAAADSGETIEVRTFTVVPEESNASYIVDEEFLGGALGKLGIAAGEVDVIGSTQTLEGQLQLNLADLSAALGTNRFTVNLSTLKTDEDRRDNWIQENGPEFGKFSLAEFVATSLSDTPTSYNDGDEVQFKMNGDLTIRDITNAVTFDVSAKLEGDTLSGTATVPLLMSDFGIDPPNFANTLTVKDAFEVSVDFVAKEK